MDQPTCATCRFFLSLPSADGVPAKHGLCRRYPPIPPRNKPDPADEWCGEHAPTPDVGAPGLPAGWSLKRGADVVVGPDGERVYVDADGWVHGAGFVPLAVVEEAIRAYHARAGGAA
jgi:hypothetical protein